MHNQIRTFTGGLPSIERQSCVTWFCFLGMLCYCLVLTCVVVIVDATQLISVLHINRHFT